MCAAAFLCSWKSCYDCINVDFVFAANRRARVAVSGDTQISFLYRKYRFAIAVDVSASMFVLDAMTGELPIRQVRGLPACADSIM